MVIGEPMGALVADHPHSSIESYDSEMMCIEVAGAARYICRGRVCRLSRDTLSRDTVPDHVIARDTVPDQETATS